MIQEWNALHMVSIQKEGMKFRDHKCKRSTWIWWSVLQQLAVRHNRVLAICIQLKYNISFTKGSDCTNCVWNVSNGAGSSLKRWLTHLVKRFVSFVEPKIHHSVHKSLPSDPILSQLNPVHHSIYLTKIHSDTTLLPVHRSPKRKTFVSYHNTLRSESPIPNSQAAGPPLVSVHNYLFNIFTDSIHIWRPSAHI
jgi:hypothetical protein